MSFSSTSYSRLRQGKYDNAVTNGDSGELNEENDLLEDDVLDDSLDFRQPKTTFIRSITGGCSLVKKKCNSALRAIVKFTFGRWPIALVVLISYIGLTGGFIAIALTGRYHEFKNDISLNSFMVPDIAVSREFSAFSAAKDQDKGSVPPDYAVEQFLAGKACPENNKITNPPLRRLKRESPDFVYQNRLSWTLDLVYMAKGSNDSNIFTKERLQAIHGIEQKLMKHADYRKHCYITQLSRNDPSLKQYGYCMPPNSLTTFFFPSTNTYDGQGETLRNLDDTLTFLQSRPYFYSFVSEGYSTKKQHSRFLRAQLLFAKPVKDISPSKEAQKAEFKKFLRTYIELLEKLNNDDNVAVLYGGGDLFDYLVERALYSDLHLATISLGLIILLLLLLTFSLWLSFMAILSIVSSIAVAYFFYHVVFGIEYMGILNGVSLFVIIGIGVDDIFVFINTFRQAVDNKDLGDRIYHTISVAGKATLFTSFTTAAAFAANALSPIPAIHDFGVFMAILVASCWVSVLFIMTPTLCLWNSGIGKLEAALYDKVLSLVGLRRNERLKLPDDIRQFLSGNPTGHHYEQRPANGDLRNSNHLELTNLVENDDDDPLLVIDNEFPRVLEQHTDSLGFRIQSILYHFVAEPVVKARYFILLFYLIFFAGSIILVTMIKVSTEQPKIFKVDSNLQRWLELPEVTLHPSTTMVEDLKKLAKHLVPGAPATTRSRPVERSTKTMPTEARTRQHRSTLPKTTHAFHTILQTDTTSKSPITRKTTRQYDTTSYLSTVPRTSDVVHDKTTLATPTSETGGQEETEKTTESSGLVTTEENGMVPGDNRTSPTHFPAHRTTENPCHNKCSFTGRCVLQNGTATCQCQLPYTGETCSIYCPVRTMEGNCCKIPFIYKKKPQQGCIVDETNTRSWCSLTDNYDADRKNGYCNTTVEHKCEVRTLTINKTCCIFPFVYDMVQYYYCITTKNTSSEDKYCGIHRHVQSEAELRKCNIPKPPPSIRKLCSNDHPCKPAKKPVDGTTAIVYVVFGLKGINTASIDRRHVLEQKEGTILYDDEFSLDMSCNTDEMIKALCFLCKKFASNSDLVTPGGADCFPDYIRSAFGIKYTDDCEDLPKVHRHHNKAKSIVVIKNQTKLKWFAMAFQSTTNKLSSYSSQQKDYREWEKFLKEVLADKIIPESLKKGFQTSETWVKMFSGMIVVNSAVYGIVVSLVLCLAAVVIFTGHILLFVVLFVTILGVLLMVIAIFYLTGWQLGGVEAVSLSILVGTSVDYCFHLVEGFILAGKAVQPSLNAKKSRQWRAKAAMSHIGMSIVSSGLTTILAAIPLCLTQIQLFAKFGLIVTINTSISLLYTMTVTMALLATIGPARFRASISACLVGTVVVVVCGGVVFLILYMVSAIGGYCIPSPQGTPLFKCR